MPKVVVYSSRSRWCGISSFKPVKQDVSKWWSSSACSCCWDLVFFWQTTLWPLKLKSICYFTSSIISVVFTCRQQKFSKRNVCTYEMWYCLWSISFSVTKLDEFHGLNDDCVWAYFYLYKRGLQGMVWNCFICIFIYSSIPETALI